MVKKGPGGQAHKGRKSSSSERPATRGGRCRRARPGLRAATAGVWAAGGPPGRAAPARAGPAPPRR
eukprot:8426802-Pyramimonas_sp.AAC.1